MPNYNVHKDELEKRVNVSDPWAWYNESSIQVRMYSPFDDVVRIIFESIDDVAVYRDFNEWDFDANWEFCKEWLYDKIPDIVNCEWMYEHGYCPF